MSFTLLSPDDYLSINDSVYWGADSSNYNKTNFKFVFDVLKNDVLLMRSKIYPEPNTQRGFFDVAPILRNMLDIDWLETPVNYDNTILVKQLNNTNNLEVNYVIQAGEEYNDGFSGITTLNMASGTSSVWNYVPNIWERQFNAYDDFENEFITNRPKKAKVSYNPNSIFPERFLIGLTSNDITINDKIFFTIKTYDINNNIIKLRNEFINTDSSNEFPYAELDISPYGLQSQWAVIHGSDEDIITSSVAYYDFFITDSDTNEIDKFRIYVDHCEGLYPIYNLHFMNALGFYDTARFTCVDKLQMQLTRKSFNRKDVRFKDTDSGVLPQYYNSYKLNETKINYGQDINHTLKLTMDFPTDEEYEWLSELMYSPLIYLAKDGYYYPVTIKNTNYDYIKRLSSKLKTLEVDVELNLKRNAIKR
jgi:hypothetical protein